MPGVVATRASGFASVGWQLHICLLMIAASVPSKVRNCAVPPERLRSEILSLRTCKIPDLIPHSPCNA